MASLSEMGIQVVESEEQEDGEAPAAPVEKAEEAEEEQTGNIDEATVGRTDDPVRMYLREMGSVELLSREGEIAISQADRGRPRHDDQRAVRKPADLRRDHLLARPAQGARPDVVAGHHRFGSD